MVITPFGNKLVTTHSLTIIFLLFTGIVKKMFWGTLFTLSVIALIGHVTIVSINFFSYKVGVTVKLQHEKELTFPAVTICNMSPVRKSALEASGMEDLSASAKKRKKRAVGKNIIVVRDYRFYFPYLYYIQASITYIQSN